MSFLALIIASAVLKGGQITMFGGTAPKSANAYVDNSHYTSEAFGLVYMTLLGYDEETGELEGALAKSWSVSEDARKYTFVIDDRAYWSDGKKVTSHDVKWTFDTIMSPANDTGPWKSMLAFFDSPIIENDYTVTFVKKGDSPEDWRDILNCSSFWILPRHRFCSQNFNRVDMIGEVSGGPYSYESSIDEIETTLRRNKNWWKAADEKLKDKYNFDRIKFKYFATRENAFTAFKRGKIDYFPVYSASRMAQQTFSEEFSRNYILKRRVLNESPVGFQGFAMNMRRPPFDDINVRKAVAHLVDRERMNKTLMHGEYFLLKSYYTDLYTDEIPCENEFFEFNPLKASDYLDKAGWKLNANTGLRMKGGKKLEFTYLSRGADEDRYLSLFSEALRQAGITMKIERKDFASWMRDMDDFNYDMTIAAWGAGLVKYPSIQWLSTEADRKGSNNITGFKNSEVDKLISAERSMKTRRERNQAYRRIDAIVASEVPYVLLWQCRESRILYWNKFGMPKYILPRYSREEGALTTWWIDRDREEELSMQMAKNAFLPKVPERVHFGASSKGTKK